MELAYSYDIEHLIDSQPAGLAAARSSDHSKRPFLLPKLPPGRFRSLGGIFDYEAWPERDRFLYLDSILASRLSDDAADRKPS